MTDLVFEKRIVFRFALEVPSPQGITTIPITTEQYQQLEPLMVSDPMFVAATVLGVTKTQLAAWLNDNYNVICSGRTKKGHRCRRVARDGFAVNVKEYVNRQGYKCEIHEGQA